MFARKHQIAGGLLVAAALIGMTQQGHGQGREVPGREARQEIRGVVKSVAAGAITLSFGPGRDREPAPDKTYSLAKNVEVAIGSGGRGGVGGLFKEGKLADLAAGISVTLTLTADQKKVESILAEGPTVRGILKAVDAKKNTVTISQAAQPARERGEQPAAGEEKTYAVAAGAEIAVDDGRGRRFSIQEAKLADLGQGALVSAQLSLDKKEVHALLAAGPTLSGTIKAIDAAKKSLTLAGRPTRGEEAQEEQKLTVSSDAVILIDDGKGRRLSLKEARLADLPAGATVNLKLSADQAFVMFIRAEGPTLTGLLKAVNPDKLTITISIPKGRDDAEEKTLAVAKDARIALDGSETKLGNLKPGENGPLIQLRLSLDQRTVQAIMARQPQPR